MDDARLAALVQGEGPADVLPALRAASVQVCWKGRTFFHTLPWVMLPLRGLGAAARSYLQLPCSAFV